MWIFAFIWCVDAKNVIWAAGFNTAWAVLVLHNSVLITQRRDVCIHRWRGVIFTAAVSFLYVWLAQGPFSPHGSPAAYRELQHFQHSQDELICYSDALWLNSAGIKKKTWNMKHQECGPACWTSSPPLQGPCSSLQPRSKQYESQQTLVSLHPVQLTDFSLLT